MNDIQVFSKEWFVRHQRTILFFANTWVGRRFFGIQNDVPRGKKLTGMLPHCMTWRSSDGSYCTDFRTHPKFAKRLYRGLKPLWLVLHGWDMVFGQQAKALNFGFDTLTRYPSAGTNSPIDGFLGRSAVDEPFTTIRAGNGTQVGETSASNLIAQLTGSTTASQFSELDVGIFLFDTSVISNNYKVDAAVLSLYGSSKTSNLGQADLHIASGTTATNNNLANSDFEGRGHTSFASVSFANFSTTGYNHFFLNAQGLLSISKTGISKFTSQLSWDINNAFGGVWSSGAVTQFQAYYADEAGTSKDPRLIVAYSLAPTPAFALDVNFDGISLISNVPGLRIMATDPYKKPTRKVRIYDILHSNRRKATSGYYYGKEITVRACISRNTRTQAEQADDILQGLLHGIERPLLLDQAGKRRVYYATLDDVVYHIAGGSYLEFDLVFVCSDSFGYDPVWVQNLELTGEPVQYLYFEGSAPTQVPKITALYTAISGGTGKSVVFGNNQTLQTVTVTRDWVAGDLLVIDAFAGEVRVNGAEVAYTGSIPEWTSGLGALSYSDNFSSKTLVGNVGYNMRYK